MYNWSCHLLGVSKTIYETIPLKNMAKISQYRISGGTIIWCLKKNGPFIDNIIPQNVEHMTNFKYQNIIEFR